MRTINAIISVHPSYLYDWRDGICSIKIENVARNKFFVQTRQKPIKKLCRKQWCRFTFTFLKVSIKIWERKWLIVRFAQIFPIFASLLWDIRGMEVRGWKKQKKKKKKTFRLSSRLPFTWLARSRKGNGVGVKASHCEGSVHRRSLEQKGKPLAPRVAQPDHSTSGEGGGDAERAGCRFARGNAERARIYLAFEGWIWDSGVFGEVDGMV